MKMKLSSKPFILRISTEGNDMQSKHLTYILIIILMSVCAFAQSLTNGAVSHWTFNETAPTTVFSDSLNYEPLNGTPDSGASGEVGIVSNALNSSMVYNAVTTDNLDAKTAFESSDFTISLWYFGNGVPAGGTFIASNAGCPAGNPSDGLQWDSDGSGNPRVILGGSVDLSFSKSLLNASLWNSIILTRSNTSATIYVNGQPADTTGVTTYNPPNGAGCFMRVGAYNDGINLLDSKIDEVTFYDVGGFTQTQANGIFMNVTHGIPFPYIQAGGGDTQAPQVRIIQPLTNTVYHNTSIQVNFTVNATDNTGVQSVYMNLTTPTVTGIILNMTLLSQDIYNASFISNDVGEYFWTVTALDNSSNAGTASADYFVNNAVQLNPVGGCPNRDLPTTFMFIGMGLFIVCIWGFNKATPRGIPIVGVVCGIAIFFLGLAVISCDSDMGYLIMALGALIALGEAIFSG